MPSEVIQIIEDDPQHAQLLDHTLRKAGYRTNVAHHGLTGLEDVRRLHPSLVLLDIMLPELDGHEVCRRLRADPETKATPIIMLSALAGEEHRTVGLNLGADDYIAKPFSPKEVVLRIKAVLRRSRQSAHSGEVYLNGELLLEESRHRVSFRGKSVELSDPEWQILQALARQPGRTVMRRDLIMLLWGDDGLIHQQELERFIRSLGQKLEAGSETGSLILMTPGFGYQLRTFRSQADESVR
jgi:two-component system phosphate regulon response regulator PhoB